MILSVKVSDETYEKYGRQNTKNPREPIEAVIEKYAGLGNAKALIITGEQLAALQRAVGQIDSPESLLKVVQKLTSVRIGELSFPLTESQVKGVLDNSKFYAQTPDAWATMKIKEALKNALGV